MPTTARSGGASEIDVVFRGYNPADGPELLALINKGYGISRNERYWKWKFDENPAGRGLSCVVVRDGVIVAHFGGLPVRFVVNGEERLAVQDVDDLVDASHRTFQGVYHVNKCRVGLHREANVDFMYGFAIEVTSKVSQTQYGYGQVARIPRLVKVLDYKPFLKSHPRFKLLSPLGGLVNAWKRLTGGGTAAPPAGTRIEPVDRFDDRYDQLWSRMKDDYPIMVVRDAAYLNWRYVDIPHVETTRFALTDESTGEVLGYVVLSENHETLPRGRILDLVTPRNADPSVARTLISHAVAHFRSRGIAIVACWMFPHCHLSEPLSGAGFRPRLDQWRDVMFRNADLDHPAHPEKFALEDQNWFLAIGDSDMT